VEFILHLRGQCVQAFGVVEGDDLRSVTLVFQCCYSGVTVVLQWCYSGVTVVLQWNSLPISAVRAFKRVGSL
jgi:hypothetical protein